MSRKVLFSICHTVLNGALLAFAFLMGGMAPFQTSATAQEVEPFFGIAQGPTSDTHTQFAVLAPIAEQVQPAVFDSEGRPQTILRLTRARRAFSEWEVLQFEVEGLDPAKFYDLKIFDRQNDLRDLRHFRTLPIHARQARIATLSCMADAFLNASSWNRLEERSPDVILMLGDQVYLDRPNMLFQTKPKTEEDIWNRHVSARNKLTIFSWKFLHPIVTVWDDHDFGYDNLRPPWVLQEASFKAYNDFFPRRPIPGVYENGPGMSSNYRLFHQNIVILDGRSFQSRDVNGTMFGHEQEKWLIERANTPVTWFANGSQMWGGYLEKDSFEFNHPDEFKEFARRLAQLPTRFLFFDGDVHFSEVMKLETELLGYETREFTSSSMHSSSYPGRHIVNDLLGRKNPRRLGATSTHNFMVHDVKTEESGAVRLDTRIVTWRGEEPYHDEFRLEPFGTPSPCEKILVSR